MAKPRQAADPGTGGCLEGEREALRRHWHDAGIGAQRNCRIAHRGEGRMPGLAPAGEHLFFASPKKRCQKKGDPASCVPPLRCGQPGVLARGACRRTHCALSRSAQTDASPDPPAAALLGTATRAQTSIRAIAALGPIKDIRVAVDRSCISPGRAQQRPVGFPALVDAPAAGCLRGGMRAGARMLR